MHLVKVCMYDAFSQSVSDCKQYMLNADTGILESSIFNCSTTDSELASLTKWTSPVKMTTAKLHTQMSQMDYHNYMLYMPLKEWEWRN